MDETGAVGQTGDAIPRRGTVRSGRGGREGEALWRARLDRVQEDSAVMRYVAVDPRLHDDVVSVIPILLSCRGMRIGKKIHVGEERLRIAASSPVLEF
jgi:hypothetical protein